MKTSIHRVPHKWLSVSLSCLGIVIGLALFLFFLVSGTDNGSDYSRAFDLLGALFFILGGCVTINLYPDIEVLENGLRVQVFGFRWVFVPWHDIVAVEPLENPFSSRPRGVVVRLQRGLTPIHLLIVASMTKHMTRGFVISNAIGGYEQLVETICSKYSQVNL